MLWIFGFNSDRLNVVNHQVSSWGHNTAHYIRILLGSIISLECKFKQRLFLLACLMVETAQSQRPAGDLLSIKAWFRRVLEYLPWTTLLDELCKKHQDFWSICQAQSKEQQSVKLNLKWVKIYIMNHVSSLSSHTSKQVLWHTTLTAQCAICFCSHLWHTAHLASTREYISLTKVISGWLLRSVSVYRYTTT